jgi:hypothetical protein
MKGHSQIIFVVARYTDRGRGDKEKKKKKQKQQEDNQETKCKKCKRTFKNRGALE